jgi:hypothetical protein
MRLTPAVMFLDARFPRSVALNGEQYLGHFRITQLTIADKRMLAAHYFVVVYNR